MNDSILVTGASGFIGSSVCERLSVTRRIKAQHRRVNTDSPLDNVDFVIGEFSKAFDWRDALQGVGVVIHCAARAHVLDEISSDPLTEFREVNTFGTLNLATQAAASGVRHFIFVSSLSVHGINSGDGVFTVDSPPNPSTPYAISKYEAELALWRISRQTGMSITIIRPPLVYGPNAPGKFGLLVRCLNRRVPLPLGALTNKRSFVFLDNLVDLIIHCIDHPNAVNQVFLVSDDEDISTTQLLRKIGSALKKPTLLLPVPMFILNVVAMVFGKSIVAQQLLGSLLVDMEKTKSMLKWSPAFNVDSAICKTIEDTNL